MNARRKMMIGVGMVLGTLVVAVGVLAANYYSLLADVRETFVTVDTSDAIAYGATLFQTRACSACHTLSVAGATGEVGPSLDGLRQRADAASVRQSIVDPNAVIASGCPEEACEAGVMPPFGSVLTDAQVDALVAYLLAQ